MAGHRIRALAGVVLAGATLALAACTSGASAGQSGTQAAGVPVKNGTVVVHQGDKIICTMTVVNGKGTCKVPAASLGVGRSQIVGSYSGQGYGSSNSDPVGMTITAAPTATTLTLSPATVTFGHEQTGRLSAKVAAKQGGTPTKTVVVQANGATVCVIYLSGGVGSCTLPASKLSVGAHELTAVYSGDLLHTGSSSTAQTLTVVK
jgi:Bacterial Ig-like domain (group 3)